MIFGKIEYLNLLPFHIFLKRYYSSSRMHQTLHHKKGVPSNVNKDFLARRIDAAFISSVVAKKHGRNAMLGIIAKGKVMSVLLFPDEQHAEDRASATSNALVKILNLRGKVIIGDPALRYSMNNDNFIDLAQEWYQRTRLPFVFALLCTNKKHTEVQKLSRAFLREKKIKIPGYLLQKAADKSGISPQHILYYLEHIHYEVDHKARKSVKKFWHLSHNL